jgi:hypothetical protein
VVSTPSEVILKIVPFRLAPLDRGSALQFAVVSQSQRAVGFRAVRPREEIQNGQFTSRSDFEHSARLIDASFGCCPVMVAVRALVCGPGENLRSCWS